MTTIVHRTPGLLDPRSFTISGMSAKPGTTSPIGQFGTGLKYALAGLLRSGADVSIWIGREHWQFELSPTTFRGTHFEQIIAWRRAWGGLRRHRVTLPFTTQLGPHWTWWMFFRELETNTRDERGDTLCVGPDAGGFWAYVDGEDQYQNVRPDDEHTLIIVTHPEYVTAYKQRMEVFHPDADGPADAADRVLQVMPDASQRLYYRGLRVLDLRLPSVVTWNILETTPLTEDRTMHEWYARQAIARWLVGVCDDEALIVAVLGADEDTWEHGLEFPHHIRPSEAFDRASRRIRRPGPRLGSYMGAWAPAAPPDTRTFWERRGRAWRLAEEQILDASGREIFSKPVTLSQDEWREVAGTLIAAVRLPAEDHCPTCHQSLRLSPPLHQAVVGDLYAELYHDWVIVDEGLEMEHDRCSGCGLDYSYDVQWDFCPGPAWMREEVVVEDEHGNLPGDPAHGSGMDAQAYADVCDAVEADEPVCNTCSRPLTQHEIGVHEACTMPPQPPAPSPYPEVILTHRDSGEPVTFPAAPDCATCGRVRVTRFGDICKDCDDSVPF